MLMFSAGLEIDLNRFRQAQARSVTFGVVKAMAPQVLGTAFGLAFGYAIIPALVIGSLLASHTLLGLPIIVRLGAIGLLPVAVTMGATMVSLIIFGICVSTCTTGFSPSGLAVQIIEVAIFVPLILVGVSRAGSWVLNRLRDNEEGYFVAMLSIMAVSGVLADLITCRTSSARSWQDEPSTPRLKAIPRRPNWNSSARLYSRQSSSSLRASSSRPSRWVGPSSKISGWWLASSPLLSLERESLRISLAALSATRLGRD
jgi:hypothetical protein